MPIHWWSAPQVAQRYHSHTDDSWILTDLSAVLSHLSWGVPVLTSPVRLLGWFIYVRWSQLSVWHRRRTTSVISLLVTTGCVPSSENTIWVDLYMFAGHNCLCDIADEQPLLYYCWSQLAVWHRRRTPSGLIYMLMCNRWVSLWSVTTVYVTLLERTRWIYKRSQLSVWHSLYWATGLFYLYNCDCIILTMSSESNEEAALLPGSSVHRNHTYKSHVRAPGPVDIRGDDRKINWELHNQMWENFCILSEIENAPTRVQKAEFFNSLGMEALKTCNGLDIGDEDIVSDIMGKIDGYCIGQTNDAMEQFKFNNRDQRPGESFSAWVTDLRSMLKNCNFDNMTISVEEMMLRNRIIQGINDKATQAKMLDKKNPDLDTIVNIARTCEATQLHLKTMAAGSSDVHKVTGQKHKFRRKKPHGGNKPTNILKCRFCSGKHPM